MLVEPWRNRWLCRHIHDLHILNGEGNLFIDESCVPEYGLLHLAKKKKPSPGNENSR